MTHRRAALGLLAACVLLAAGSLLFLALNGSTTHSNTIGEPVVDALFGLVYLSFPAVGAAIAAASEQLESSANQKGRPAYEPAMVQKAEMGRR